MDSAFRRIPLCPQHRLAATVAYKVYDTMLMLLILLACLDHLLRFTIGNAFLPVTRNLLHNAVRSYVDDWFGPARMATMEHAKRSVGSLIRVLLGTTAASDKKLECGAILIIFGCANYAV